MKLGQSKKHEKRVFGMKMKVFTWKSCFAGKIFISKHVAKKYGLLLVMVFIPAITMFALPHRQQY